MSYEAPRVTDIGSVAELTLQRYNKVGSSSDAFSPTTPLVGSLVAVP